MNTKTLSYAYPTSPQARKLGFGHIGCWYIEIDGSLVATFPTRQKRDALEKFESIPLPASTYSFTKDHAAFTVC
jgi:hypothetical protein